MCLARDTNQCSTVPVSLPECHRHVAGIQKVLWRSKVCRTINNALVLQRLITSYKVLQLLTKFKSAKS